MQEPLDNLSADAQQVHAYLAEDPNRSVKLEVIAEALDLTPGETANALRELKAGTRAVEDFRGWSVLS